MLIELKVRNGLAIAVKYAEDLNDIRTVEKLQIEKVFWEQQGYEWKLFTEQEITSAIKENLEWLHAAHQNSNDLYTELSLSDIQLVYQRLAASEKRLSTVCSALDDEYSCEPGFHIGVTRKAIAANLIDVPLGKVFRQCDFFGPCRHPSLKEKGKVRTDQEYKEKWVNDMKEKLSEFKKS